MHASIRRRCCRRKQCGGQEAPRTWACCILCCAAAKGFTACTMGFRGGGLRGVASPAQGKQAGRAPASAATATLGAPLAASTAAQAVGRGGLEGAPASSACRTSPQRQMEFAGPLRQAYVAGRMNKKLRLGVGVRAGVVGPGHRLCCCCSGTLNGTWADTGGRCAGRAAPAAGASVRSACALAAPTHPGPPPGTARRRRRKVRQPLLPLPGRGGLHTASNQTTAGRWQDTVPGGGLWLQVQAVWRRDGGRTNIDARGGGGGGGSVVAKVRGLGAAHVQQARGHGPRHCGRGGGGEGSGGAPPRPQLVVQRLQARKHLLEVRPAPGPAPPPCPRHLSA